MIRLGRLALLMVAIGGFVSAHALVQKGNAAEVPLPTVTVPSLPLPTTTTPTVPSLPVPTVTVTTTAPPPVPLPPVTTSPPPTRPAPAPPPPQPATTTTLTVGSPAPAGRTATPPPTPPSSRYGYTTPSAGGAAETGRPAGTRSRGLAAETHRTAHRVSVQLAFRLQKAGSRFLIVRGPAPSCRIAGYIPVRGRKGVNTVYFAGRVHGRRLQPGVYLISLSPNHRLARGAATEYVRVVSRRRSVPLPDGSRKPSCATAAAATADPTSPTLVGAAVPKRATARPAARVAGVQSPTGAENDDGAAGLPESGVLGASAGDADEKPFLAIAVLTLVSGLLLAMLALVTRFLRGSWNP